MSPENLMMLAQPASNASGPGWLLRGLVIGAIVGVILLAWLIARAGRDNH
jgi:hypothetical protein